MAKSSIGQFIAALRKVNGMTQQEVADRLHVSNKAVSRWERDECSPDISLIPVLAEMFGVTCDELLKGERILDPSLSEKKEPKVEKQVRNLINRILAGFQTMIWISLAVSAVGVVCMFGIAYGIYRPVIGFAVMLLFEVCAFDIVVLAVKRAKDMKNYNELFDEAEESLVVRYNHTLGTYSFTAFFVVFAAVLLPIPLVIYSEGYDVLSIQSYAMFAVPLGAALALIGFCCRRPYIIRITGEQQPIREQTPVDRSVRKMSVIQIGLMILAALLSVIAPYCDSVQEPAKLFSLYNVICIASIGCLVASVVWFIVILIKNRDGRREFVIPGIRNLFLIISVLSASKIHYSAWSRSYSEGESIVSEYERSDVWVAENLWFCIIWAIFVFLIFKLVDMLRKRRRK